MMVCRFDLVCEVGNECGEGVVWELYDSVTVGVDCVTVSANCNLQLHCMFDACILYIQDIILGLWKFQVQ